MVVEGIGLHVEDMLVSLFLSIIISWTFRILAHEEGKSIQSLQNIRPIVLSKALKQTKAGHLNSGTPFLVYSNFQPLEVVFRYRDPQPQVVGK